MDIPLTSDEQRKLLTWVRRAIADAVAGDPATEVPDTELTPNLRAPHAAFVTLWKHGDLRGCIGKMDFARPLWLNALEAGVAAALEDPRFPAVTEDELSDVVYEISVLNPPVAIPSWEHFDVTCHGIIVDQYGRSALLLPQVAREHGWTAEQTLTAVCEKAGLDSDAWRSPATRLRVFEASKFPS